MSSIDSAIDLNAGSVSEMLRLRLEVSLFLPLLL